MDKTKKRKGPKSAKTITTSFRSKPKKISKHRRTGNGLGYLMWEHFGSGTHCIKAPQVVLPPPQLSVRFNPQCGISFDLSTKIRG